jgi:hypothetical protein
VVASALVLVAAAGPARAQTAQICLSTQLQSAGANCHGLTRCYRTAMKRSLPLDPVCIDEQLAKINTKFNGTESVSNCLVEPAASDVFNILQPLADSLANDVHLNGGKCSAKKIGALGRECKQLLACYADAAAASTTVNPECQDKARSKLGTYFSRFDATGTCVTSGDAIPLDMQVTSAVDDVWSLVRGGGTTTTSTTSTTASTVTLPPGTCAENGDIAPCVAYRDNPACKACVDATVDTTPATLCTGAGPACDNAFNNIGCGYAINSGTTCSATCCP